MQSFSKILTLCIVIVLLAPLPLLAGRPEFESHAGAPLDGQRDSLRERGFETFPNHRDERPFIPPGRERMDYPDSFDLTPGRLPRPWELPVPRSAGAPLHFQGETGWEGILDDFLVNDDTSGGYNRQTYPEIARSFAGNVVITWMDERTGYGDIYAQLYDSSGTPMGPNFKVNDDVGPLGTVREWPDVVMDASGNFIIIWRWRTWTYDSTAIYAQRYDRNGTPLGTNFKVNDDAWSDHPGDSDVAMDYSGNFVITWDDFLDDKVYAQRYNSSGTPLGSNFLVWWGGYPYIAMDGSGNFLITLYWYWTEDPKTWGQRYTSLGTPIDSPFVVFPGWFDDIAMDFSGKFVITYSGSYNIYAQRYDSTGTPQGPDLKVNDDTTGTSLFYDPNVAVDSAGNFAVTWLREKDFSSKEDVLAQRFDLYGNRLGSNFKVNDTTLKETDYPAIALDNSGNFVITWEDYRNSIQYYNTDIYAQMYDSSGNPLGANFRVPDDFGISDQYYPAIAVDSSGRFVIAWNDERPLWGIYAQIYDPTGSPTGINFRVNDSLTWIAEEMPAIAMSDFGNFVITWMDWRHQPGGYTGIYAQMYQSDGSLLGTNFQVNDHTGSACQTGPDIAIDGSGNFVVTWIDCRDDTLKIYGQRFDSSGNPLGANFWVGGRGHLARVATDASGNFVITWVDYAVDDIFAQRYDSLCTPIGPAFKVNDDVGYAAQWYPAIAMDCSGNFIITFSDTRNGFWEIYAQRYNCSGIPLGPNFKAVDGTGAPVPYAGHVAMDCSGNFVVTWTDYYIPDVYAKRYDSSGNPVVGIFSVPHPDYVPFAQFYSAVAANNCNIYFTWQDNRRAKGWDIYANIKGYHPPDAFSLLFPPNKAFTPRGVHFDWETATDPCPSDQITYDLYVSTCYRFHPDSTTIEADLMASEHVKSLDYGTYYWKVIAKDNYGGERASDQIHSFMVTGIPYIDLNGDGIVDVGDVVFLTNYLFKSGQAPAPLELGDVNCDEVINIGDVVYLINYLFKNGPAPSC